MDYLSEKQPMLEINYGTKHESKLFPLTHVGDNTFVLSNRFIYCDIFHDIELWNIENANMTKIMYDNFV